MILSFFFVRLLPFFHFAELPFDHFQPADILLLPAQLVVERKPFFVEMFHRRLPVPVIYSFSVGLPAVQRVVRLTVLVQLELMFPLVGADLAAG